MAPRIFVSILLRASVRNISSGKFVIIIEKNMGERLSAYIYKDKGAYKL